MKKIIPNKLIIKFNDDEEVVDAVLQYRLSDGGKTENKFFTMAVHPAFDKDVLKNILSTAKQHTATGEGIQ